MDSETLLRSLLRYEPRLALEQIRAAHPGFHNRTLDHLNVRVARLLDREAIGRRR